MTPPSSTYLFSCNLFIQKSLISLMLPAKPPYSFGSTSRGTNLSKVSVFGAWKFKRAWTSGFMSGLIHDMIFVIKEVQLMTCTCWTRTGCAWNCLNFDILFTLRCQYSLLGRIWSKASALLDEFWVHAKWWLLPCQK